MFLLLFVPAGFSHAQVAIKNNLLYDAALTPNLGVEFRLPGQQHWTAALNVGYSPFKLGTDTERRWRHVLVMPEMRYWFCEAFARHFLGVNVVYSHYNASKLKLPLYSTEDFRDQGDLAGLRSEQISASRGMKNMPVSTAVTDWDSAIGSLYCLSWE